MILNIGSINADFVYSVPRLPKPGETLAASGRALYLGGKGANMSVAAARAGAHVLHLGAVGADGRWAVERLLEYGVDTRHVSEVAEPTAHAIITVDPTGENMIVIYPGANHAIPETGLNPAFALAKPGDWFITQNETNLQEEAAIRARSAGLRVAYAAAPFSAEAVESMTPHLDLLVLNEVEMEQLRDATGKQAGDLGVAQVIVTLGKRGCRLHDHADGWKGRDFPAPPVDPVDTTGAGDTFTGYLMAGLDRGQPIAQAIGLANQAAALMVTRHGTADVIPDLSEVQTMRRP
ncbi:ribokinase [Roseovarius sp. TE539]|uniref:ribokinase n=1 Tax=Roseovarius sp. TE539 TaxID=2249812 RepID=UPI000DDED025|nr:ribokinase [Roseovarius sp. TE539]RBI77616.1 ribokinase [Roseovarius sp. TE539]